MQNHLIQSRAGRQIVEYPEQPGFVKIWFLQDTHRTLNSRRTGLLFSAFHFAISVTKSFNRREYKVPFEWHFVFSAVKFNLAMELQRSCSRTGS
jgi:hypothetical protein